MSSEPPRLPVAKISLGPAGIGSVTIDGEAQRGVFKTELLSIAGKAPVLTLHHYTTVEVEIDGVKVQQVTVCPNCSAAVDEANRMRAFLHETSKRAAEEAEREPYPLTPDEKAEVQDRPRSPETSDTMDS